jgi:hypothetical protein
MGDSERENYLAKCTQWFQDHPPNSDLELKKELKEEYDRSVVQAVYDKYIRGLTRPPVDELIQAYTQAGASEKRIQKVRNFYQKCIDDSEKNQKNIDRIFFKYPSALKMLKKEPVKQKKVIRAVKKKMNVDK